MPSGMLALCILVSLVCFFFFFHLDSTFKAALFKSLQHRVPVRVTKPHLEAPPHPRCPRITRYNNGDASFAAKQPANVS